MIRHGLYVVSLIISCVTAGGLNAVDESAELRHARETEKWANQPSVTAEEIAAYQRAHRHYAATHEVLTKALQQKQQGTGDTGSHARTRASNQAMGASKSVPNTPLQASTYGREGSGRQSPLTSHADEVAGRSASSFSASRERGAATGNPNWGRAVGGPPTHTSSPHSSATPAQNEHGELIYLRSESERVVRAPGQPSADLEAYNKRRTQLEKWTETLTPDELKKEIKHASKDKTKDGKLALETLYSRKRQRKAGEQDRERQKKQDRRKTVKQAKQEDQVLRKVYKPSTMKRTKNTLHGMKKGIKTGWREAGASKRARMRADALAQQGLDPSIESIHYKGVLPSEAARQNRDEQANKLMIGARNPAQLAVEEGAVVERDPHAARDVRILDNRSRYGGG